MTNSRGFTTNDLRHGINFNNLDSLQPPMRRLSPIDLRSNAREYEDHPTRNIEKYQSSDDIRSKYLSKECLIGVGTGLLIGIILVIIIAVPVGVTKTCGIGRISSTPNWIGTYQMDNSCTLTQGCCCLTNQITLSQTSGNQMTLTGSVTGTCPGISSPYTMTESIPNGFQTNFIWNGETVIILLGQDNTFLSFINLANGYCSATAVRTSYNGANIHQNLNFIFMIFPLFISIGFIKYDY